MLAQAHLSQVIRLKDTERERNIVVYTNNTHTHTYAQSSRMQENKIEMEKK